ncbi:MAG: Spx/MgsR family RNA polymerase-binding regulatory protein [Deltaproteobacteria bacterium]|nr:Spx/MgsR family RNA polymerase-binding regulatory protein [Deltaproteobacteria bacterium]
MGEIVVYAKRSCIQCKKALAFLNRKGVHYQMKDIVHEPPPRSLLEKVIKAENIYASLNQRSTTYRDNHLGKRRTTKNEAIRLMLKDPNLIKRPLIIKDNRAYQGFDEKSLLDFVATAPLVTESPSIASPVIVLPVE